MVSDCVDFFDCGHPDLNQYLQHYALINQKAGSSKTYVCCNDSKVVGFHSLTAGSVELHKPPPRVTKGLARHPVPVIILARLAVDKSHQKKGLGRALLKDALLRTLSASEVVGIRALLVHAKDETARTWYLDWDFEPSPTDPLHLFLLIKDLKAIVNRQESQ
jgi:GNAT superfamily N-acetyltransferase